MPFPYISKGHYTVSIYTITDCKMEAYIYMDVIKLIDVYNYPLELLLIIISLNGKNLVYVIP